MRVQLNLYLISTILLFSNTTLEACSVFQSQTQIFDFVSTQTENDQGISISIDIPTFLRDPEVRDPVFIEAINFIRAQDPLILEKPPTLVWEGDRLLAKPYQIENSPLRWISRRYWRIVPSKMREIFSAVADIQFNLENFARWIGSLEKDFKTSGGLARPVSVETLTEVLENRAKLLGWSEVNRVDRFTDGVADLVRTILSHNRPHIDTWAYEDPHGPISHFIQWVYVAESLEIRFPGSSKEFFDFIANSKEAVFWVAAFDRGPGSRGLYNPGYVWSLLRNAFKGRLEGESVSYGFVSP